MSSAASPYTFHDESSCRRTSPNRARKACRAVRSASMSPDSVITHTGFRFVAAPDARLPESQGRQLIRSRYILSLLHRILDRPVLQGGLHAARERPTRDALHVKI